MAGSKKAKKNQNIIPIYSDKNIPSSQDLYAEILGEAIHIIAFVTAFNFAPIEVNYKLYVMACKISLTYVAAEIAKDQTKIVENPAETKPKRKGKNKTKAIKTQAQSKSQSRVVAIMQLSYKYFFKVFASDLIGKVLFPGLPQILKSNVLNPCMKISPKIYTAILDFDQHGWDAKTMTSLFFALLTERNLSFNAYPHEEGFNVIITPVKEICTGLFFVWLTKMSHVYLARKAEQGQNNYNFKSLMELSFLASLTASGVYFAGGRLLEDYYQELLPNLGGLEVIMATAIGLTSLMVYCGVTKDTNMLDRLGVRTFAQKVVANSSYVLGIGSGIAS